MKFSVCSHSSDHSSKVQKTITLLIQKLTILKPFVFVDWCLHYKQEKVRRQLFCCHLFFWKVYTVFIYTSYIGPLEIWPEAIFKSLVQSGFSLSHSRIIYGNLILIYNARLVSAKLALYLNSIWIFKKSRSPFMDPIKNITPKQWHNTSIFLLQIFRWFFTNK